MLTVILLLSAAFIIPHLLLRQIEYDNQVSRQRDVSFIIYNLLNESDYQLRQTRQRIAELEKQISGSHRISKRFSK